MVSSLMGLSSSGYGVIMSAGRSVMTEGTLFDTVVNRLGGEKKKKKKKDSKRILMPFLAFCDQIVFSPEMECVSRLRV